MPFTAEEIANVANAALDYYIKTQPVSSTIQDKPLLHAFMKGKKTFPGGKEFISKAVKGKYTSELEGYEHKDQVGFKNPANVKRVNFPWKELHLGIEVSHTELKKDGISIVEGGGTAEHSQAEKTRLVGIFEDKLEDMQEGYERSLDEMLHRDGTQDAKEIPGVSSIVRTSPTSGTVGGLDSGALPWWRNLVDLGITSSASTQALIKRMETFWRQLRRYGGRPNVLLAGSDFLDAYLDEQRQNGNYTDTGWNGKKADAAMGDAAFKKVDIMYDPMMDDLGEAKYLRLYDTRHLCLYFMEGEEKKKHMPERPHDQYVLYRALTSTGGLVADQLNCHGIMSIN